MRLTLYDRFKLETLDEKRVAKINGKIYLDGICEDHIEDFYYRYVEVYDFRRYYSE